jgi:alkylhydroperoxidase/carboxymuconolactone decarboxylase family protein YurZ
MNEHKAGQHFSEQHPRVYEALTELDARCAETSHLDDKTSMLIKLAVAAGLYLENTVKAHTAKALALGITEGQIEQTIMINLSAIGYPKTVAALNWVHAVTGKTPFT